MPRQPIPKQQHQAGFLESRFFVVGVVVLVFTLGITGYAIIGKPLCDDVSINSLIFLLSISGGFLAWTFAGSIVVRTRKPLFGLMIVASGGFAVFVILQMKLDPAKMRMHGSCQTQVIGADSLLSTVAVRVANLVKNFAETRDSPGERQSLRDEARELLVQIDSFPEQTLSELQKAVLSLYGAHTSAVLAMCLEVAPSDVEEAQMLIERTLTSADRAGKQFKALRKANENERLQAVEHMTKNKSPDKAIYLSGLAQIMDMQWSGVSGRTARFSDKDVHETFRPLSSDFLRKAAMGGDPPINWYCSTRAKGELPCRAL